MTSNKWHNPYLWTMVVWLSTIILAALTANSVLAAIAVFITGALPFFLIILWFSLSKTGMLIRDYFSRWHFTLMLAGFLFAYSIYARKWAAATLNGIFHIDATNLGITYTLLAALFKPFGLVYQDSVVATLWTGMIVAGMTVFLVPCFMVIVGVEFRKIMKFLVLSSLAFAIPIFVGIAAKLSSEKETLIKEFAVWADFNTEHLCANEWAENAHGVVFLGGDRVLAYFPRNPAGSQFVPERCDFAKST